VLRLQFGYDHEWIHILGGGMTRDPA
ncbi:uncharacterized protein METZ01_LOCUS408255, partial [marine metagenome]